MKRLDNGMRVDFSGNVASVSSEQKAKVEEILKECGCSGQWSVGGRTPVTLGRDDLEGLGVYEWILQINQEDVAKIQAALDKVN